MGIYGKKNLSICSHCVPVKIKISAFLAKNILLKNYQGKIT